MMQQPIQSVLNKIHSLPTLPTVVMALGERLANERVSSSDIAAIIEADQALASQVLRLANSSFFGFKNRIADIQQAISLMGFSTIRNMALAAGVMKNLAGGRASGLFSPSAFWEHSIATAVASRVIAVGRDARLASEAFTAGLLHDIGKLVLNRWFGPQFDAALARHGAERLPLLDAERAQFGFTHADVGYQLGSSWRFPAILLEAIRHHHDPAASGDYAMFVGIVRVADLLVEAVELGAGGSQYLEAIDEQTWQTLELTPAGVDAILGETLQTAQAMIDLLCIAD